MVLMLAPVMRLMARMLMPSTSIPMIVTRFSVLSLFISKLYYMLSILSRILCSFLCGFAS